jgi:hypothetical protein
MVRVVTWALDLLLPFATLAFGRELVRLFAGASLRSPRVAGFLLSCVLFVTACYGLRDKPRQL